MTPPTRGWYRDAKFIAVCLASLSIVGCSVLSEALKESDRVRRIALEPPKHPVFPAEGKIEILEVRLSRTSAADGSDAVEVTTSWYNSFGTPVKTLWADIEFYDREGNQLLDSARDYCIYAGRPVPGGEYYVEPRGEGYLHLQVFGEPVRAVVRPTRWSAHTFF